MARAELILTQVSHVGSGLKTLSHPRIFLARNRELTGSGVGYKLVPIWILAPQGAYHATVLAPRLIFYTTSIFVLKSYILIPWFMIACHALNQVYEPPQG